MTTIRINHKFNIVLFVSFLLLFILNFVACKPAKLEPPKNVRLTEEEYLTWDNVEGALGYSININDEEYFSETNQLDVFDKFLETKIYTITVFAWGDYKEYFDSDWTEEKQIEYEVSDVAQQEGVVIHPVNEELNHYGIGTLKRLSGKVVIPSEVDGKIITNVLTEAFEDNKNITGVYIPDTITTIEERAFKGCSGITRVRLPEGDCTICKESFDGVDKLKKIDVPMNCYFNGEFVFKACPDLEEINIDPGHPQYRIEGNCLFSKTQSATKVFLGFKGAVIPDYVDHIVNDAFSGRNIESIVIPDSVTKLDRNVFKDCISLKSITLNNTITALPAFFAAGCISLTEINFGNTLETVGNSAFYGCTSLAKLSFPDNVKRIDNAAFAYCGGLEELDLNKVETIGSTAFIGTDLTTVHIPRSVELGHNPFYSCKRLQEITVDDNHPLYKVDGNCLLTKDGNTLVVATLSSVIPDYVKEIGVRAFSGLPIKKIVIPVGVETIQGDAFAYCYSLQELYIPDTVTRLVCDTAFVGLEALQGLTTPDNMVVETYTASNPTKATYSSVLNTDPHVDSTVAYENHYPYVESILLKVITEIWWDTFYLVAPSRQGYTFAGWSKTPGGAVDYPTRVWTFRGSTETNAYGQGTSHLTFKKTVTFSTEEEMSSIKEPTRLYAVWVPNE